jgi:hypothetical protein
VIAVALAALAVAFGVSIVYARLFRSQERAHARAERTWETERARLIDQMCNLADKPWSPPPARAAAPRVEAERSPDPDDELALY